MGHVHWEASDGLCTLGSRQWAMYSGRQAVSCVQWEAGGGPCTVGGRQCAVYTGRQAMDCVHWELGGGPCTLGRGLWWAAVGAWEGVQQVTESDSLSLNHSPAHVPLASARGQEVGCDGRESLPPSCA